MADRSARVLQSKRLDMIAKHKAELLMARENLERIKIEWKKACREKENAMREISASKRALDRLNQESPDWEHHHTERFKRRVYQNIEDAKKRDSDALKIIETIRPHWIEANKDEEHCENMIRLYQ